MYGSPPGDAGPGFPSPPSGKPTVNCEVCAGALYNDLKGSGYDVTYTILRHYTRTKDSRSPTGWAWHPARPWAWHTLVDVRTKDAIRRCAIRRWDEKAGSPPSRNHRITGLHGDARAQVR